MVNGSGVADRGGLPKGAQSKGDEGRHNQPMKTSWPGLNIRRERKRGWKELHRTGAMWHVWEWGVDRGDDDFSRCVEI